MLDILGIKCEVLDSQEAGRMFDSQITQPTEGIKYKAHTERDHRGGYAWIKQGSTNL